MRYLTPSLPRYGERLYALEGERRDTLRWRDLGVQPITFPQTHEKDYSGLAQAVSGLADHMRRGVLDWQREIMAIASNSPLYIDEESAGIIEQALADPVKTRFLR